MTVMLLQRFASPNANNSQKVNDGVAPSAPSTVTSVGYAQSTSPSVTSLSSTSPATPLPFLFLLESQESWEDQNSQNHLDHHQDQSIVNGDNFGGSLPTSSCTSSVDFASSGLYGRYKLPPLGSLIIDDTSATNVGPTNHDNENENDDFTVRNNNNNNRRNSRINYRQSHNNNNSNNNPSTTNTNNNNNSLIILSDLAETGRKLGGQFHCEKRDIEGWIVGGEGIGIGICTVGGVRDCSGGIAAAAGSGSVTGGTVVGNANGRGSRGFERFGEGPAGGGSILSTGQSADQRIGGGGGCGGAVAASSAATAASNSSTCGPIAGLTRLDSQGVAMRYYRLWIYACNIVLLGSALGFAAAVSRTLIFSGDPRRHLVPGVPRALDPTALYAYLALATQLGLVQLLGCIAARRLCARLLNAYWMLLLALLFGDAVIGVAWVFRFEKMRAEIRPSLRMRLQLEYGKETRFSEQWDRLQRDFSCCGISGREDFDTPSLGRLPQTCCPTSTLAAAAIVTGNYNGNASDANFPAASNVVTCQHPYPRGCEDSLVDWLRKTADLLFVLGICVIAFAKLCFLGILRYEIREMIQKIKLLREPPLPPVSAIMGGSSSVLCTSPPFVQSYSQLGVSPVVDPILTTTTVTHINNNNNNNNMSSNNNNNASAGAGPRRTTLPMAVLPSGNSSILQQSDDYSGVRHPLLSSNLQDGGADSDTNSHCALILEETTPPSISTHSGCTASTRPDKSNGNNNYEMREFNRRLLISNGTAPGNMNTSVPRNRRT